MKKDIYSNSCYVVLAQVVDIVQTAIDNGNFKTLVAALQAADLVMALKGPGPFTVFAPTDAAFNKLPAGTVDDLLKPENKDKLTRILKYHVIANRNLTAAAIIALGLPVKVETFEGSAVTVTQDGTNLKVNDATVITPDVFATNGMIHAIDTVLMPPAEVVDIVDTAINNGNFKTLVAALTAADLVTALRGAGPFTVFAPTDAAFDKLPAGTVIDLLKPENKAKLTRILQYHVIANRNLTAAAIIALNPPVKLETLSGNAVTVTKDGPNLKVNDATVIIADVFATNGMIHAIDTVLMPPAELADIVDTALNNGNFKTLVAALTAADLVTALRGAGPFTVFAPTDAAFDKLPAGTVIDLLKPENKAKLTRILQYHVIANRNLTAAAIIALNPPVKLETLSGNEVTVTKDGTNLKVNDATVIIADVFATNGMIHAIDTVLMPPSPAPNMAACLHFNLELVSVVVTTILLSYHCFF
jgi:transforming growth factor-beta-induced protein